MLTILTAVAWGEPTPYVVLSGERPGDGFGFTVSGAGDVNGDGFKDAIVGAPFVAVDIGRAYVFFGGSAADDVADLTLNGDPASHLFGVSVSKAGDVNADGFDDIIVGAENSGAYLFFGGTAPDEIADLVLLGEDVSDFFGHSVSTIGDFNDDGFHDVIVGAPGNDYSGHDAGRAYVYFGGPSLDTSADAVLSGEGTDDYFGYSVSVAGDANGDGYEDLFVGARSNAIYEPGRAYLYYGGPGFDAIADLTLTENTLIPGFAHSVSGGIDVNGDGFDEVVVGHFYGEIARVYYGIPQPDATPLADLSLTTPPEDWFGMSVSGAGDLNGDNYGDLMVGAPSAQRAYVYLGGRNPDTIYDIAIFEGATGFGAQVSGSGDFNGDGFDDMIVATPFIDSGRAYIYLGGSDLGVSGQDATGIGLDPPATGHLSLSPPFPNPLFGTRPSLVKFTLDRPVPVRLLLQDVQGRTVAQRASESFTSGNHSVSWSPGDLPSGVYYLRIEAGADAASTKWVIVR